MRPLEGITVVTLEHAIAAPFATRQLADLGARVIKIERPGVGDFARGYDERVRGLASHFVWTNRSKESLTLDVKHPRGRQGAGTPGPREGRRRGAEPGARRRGAARPRLRRAVGAQAGDHRLRHLRLRRRTAPYRDKKAYDLLIQSEVGLRVGHRHARTSRARPARRSPTSRPACTPTRNILAALLQRAQTGRGQHIDISMLESLVEWMSYPLYYAFDGAPPPPRTGASHATIYPYGPFPAGDGKAA